MPYLMPNFNTPFGFQPVEQAGVPAETHTYWVSTSQGAGPGGTFAVVPGDVVVVRSTTILAASIPNAFVSVAASGGLSLSGTGTSFIVGVVAGPPVIATPSVTTAVLVYDDPDQVFVVQDDGTATAGMGASGGVVGISYAFNATATGVAGGVGGSTGNTARSGMTLASSGYAAQTNVIVISGSNANRTAPVKVLNMHPIEWQTRVAPGVDLNASVAATGVNAAGFPQGWPTGSGQYRKWLVKFAYHALQTAPSA